jgi:hypothetical protein
MSALKKTKQHKLQDNPLPLNTYKSEVPKSTKNKIGFISTIMLVIGSSVGAGIFIKN